MNIDKKPFRAVVRDIPNVGVGKYLRASLRGHFGRYRQVPGFLVAKDTEDGREVILIQADEEIPERHLRERLDFFQGRNIPDMPKEGYTVKLEILVDESPLVQPTIDQGATSVQKSTARPGSWRERYLTAERTLLLYHQRFGDPDFVQAVFNRSRSLQRTVNALEGKVQEVSKENERLLAVRYDPQALNIYEHSVLVARKLLGIEFAQCSKLYDEKFPGGLEDDIRIALEGDLMQFVLSPEIIELCSPDKAGLDLGQDITGIKEEALERMGGFESSQYYRQSHFAYIGALKILEERSEKEINPQMVEIAERIKRDFEEIMEAWEQKRSHAEVAYGKVLEREELYTIAKAVAPEKMLGITVPIVALSQRTPDFQLFHVITPATEDTEHSNLFRDLFWDLSHSLKAAVRGYSVVPNMLLASGTRVLGVTMPLSQPSLPSVDELVQGMDQAYRNFALSKIGVNIRIFRFGEYHGRAG